MNLLLKGKKALITGGTRGIGRAIAKTFVQQGCSVAIFGTNAAKGKEAIEEISPFLSEGQQLEFFIVDVSQTKAVDEGIKQVFEKFGQIDVLVNNAGITRDGLLMKMSEEEWDAVLATNLKSLFNTCHAVIRTMMKARSGRIINISSVVGISGNAGQTNYAASKAGVIGFTKSLAKEAGSRNILVNCIAPGFIPTDMTDALSDAQKQELNKQISLQRLGKPEDIAHAALFLASPLADYITGQVLVVDGGMAL